MKPTANSENSDDQERERVDAGGFDIDLNLPPGTMRLFKNMNFSAWYAIGEFVDNSITSALKNFEALVEKNGDTYFLQIDIDFLEDGSLRVSDNAAGITKDEFQRALRIGEPPTSTNVGLSVHGVGMKMAAFWWGEELNIQTWPVSEEHGWNFRVNVNDLDGSAASGHRHVEAIPSRTPGTVVTIKGLYQKKPETTTVNLIRDHLASIYRLYLDGSEELQVVIQYGGKPLAYQRPLLLRAPYWDSPRGPAQGAETIEWRKEVKIELSDGKVITGWVGIMEKMKARQSGLFLHFRGKGIKGALPVEDREGTSQVLPYKPPLIFGAPGTARDKSLIGELDVSALGKTVTTDAMPWDLSTEHAFITELNRQLQDPSMHVLAMAENYRRDRGKRAQEELEEDAKSLVKTAKEFGELLGGLDHADPLPRASTATVTEEDSTEFRIPDQQGHVHEFHVAFTNEATEPLLDVLTSMADQTHKVRINEAHPALAEVGPIEGEVRRTLLTVLLYFAAAEVFLTSANKELIRAKFNELLDRARVQR